MLHDYSICCMTTVYAAVDARQLDRRMYIQYSRYKTGGQEDVQYSRYKTGGQEDV